MSSKPQASSPLSQVLQLVARLDRIRKENRWKLYYPDSGPLSRDMYPRHIEFFEAGMHYRERLFLAANRIGKTEGVGGYEVMLHMTGLYPDWWPGRRYDRPVKVWAAGDTGKSVRETIQEKLLGPWGEFGTGIIPGSRIIKATSKPGVSEAVELLTVRHISGGRSRLVFKSYDQKRIAFQGSEQDVIWLDEEPPLDIYTECLLRTMTVNGMVMSTFTPLQGLTDVVLQFMPDGEVPARGESRE